MNVTLKISITCVRCCWPWETCTAVTFTGSPAEPAATFWVTPAAAEETIGIAPPTVAV